MKTGMIEFDGIEYPDGVRVGSQGAGSDGGVAAAPEKRIVSKTTGI